MEAALEKKIKKLLTRLSEVEHALGEPGVFDDQEKYRSLTQEHAYLTNVSNTWGKILRLQREHDESLAMLAVESDEEFIEVLKEEIAKIEEKLPKLKQTLEGLLIPPDPHDHSDTIIELRAGTGGEEAALFVGDCLRMYRMFADRQGWKCDVLLATFSEVGGCKEAVIGLSGTNVYRFLKYEAGTHRVQRVPETEAQGRIHTSAITVAVLLEPGEDEGIVLDPKDLRVDTYRSSGAGGQHVNVTDSAVRITHLPTGAVSCCQQEKSQHKNKEIALRLLKAKLAELQRKQKEEELASTRAQQVGSGDRSERIRTYNFPQNRVTDHRINMTIYNLDAVMDGFLDELVMSLVAHFHQKQLEEES